MKITLQLAVVMIVALCLGMPAALGDKKSSQKNVKREKVTFVVEITGIKKVEGAHINVKLAPAGGKSKSQSKRPKISFKNCKKAGSKCGKATAKFKKVESGVMHKLTVCHTRRSGNDCRTGSGGRTLEAGEVSNITPSESKSSYTVNLGNKY